MMNNEYAICNKYTFTFAPIVGFLIGDLEYYTNLYYIDLDNDRKEIKLLLGNNIFSG
jgi:hypothetical protein